MLLINGERVTLPAYVNAMSVFAYSSARLDILRGAPEERRRFLDRGIASIDPALPRSAQRYGRALQAAQRAAAPSGSAVVARRLGRRSSSPPRRRSSARAPRTPRRSRRVRGDRRGARLPHPQSRDRLPAERRRRPAARSAATSCARACRWSARSATCSSSPSTAGRPPRCFRAASRR